MMKLGAIQERLVEIQRRIADMPGWVPVCLGFFWLLAILSCAFVYAGPPSGPSSNPSSQTPTFTDTQNDGEGYSGHLWGSKSDVSYPTQTEETDEIDLLGFVFNVPIKQTVFDGSIVGERIDIDLLPRFATKSEDPTQYLYYNGNWRWS